MMPSITNLDHLNYTPVNEETFSKWCTEFMEKLRQQEENTRTEQDLRKTGKQLFMEKGGDIEDLTLNEEEAKGLLDEEQKAEDEDLIIREQQQEGALYDKDLFAQELVDDDEDVDFD